jgi:hypothetical protein
VSALGVVALVIVGVLRLLKGYATHERTVFDQVTQARADAGRRFYTGNARALNTRVESVPSNLVASVFHVDQAAYFPLDDPDARNAIKVDLGSSTS